jgi:hypothetical protein
MLTILIALSFVAPILQAQTPVAADPLAPIAFLVGTWEGVAEGQPGKGTARRIYSRALNNRFIRAVHRGEYPPQEKNPKGEIHEDEGFFSVDRARKRIVFRQFHTESFVVTYIETGETTPAKIVFESEGIENIPAGFRARETYVSLGPDAFEETFEMAEPGERFEVYSKTSFRRVK